MNGLIKFGLYANQTQKNVFNVLSTLSEQFCPCEGSSKLKVPRSLPAVRKELGGSDAQIPQ
jgi:hypothetical protein